MVRLLNELVGLPPETSPAELGCAIDRHFQAVLTRAAEGDVNAQRELVALRVAYINWAYSGQDARRTM
mgnify:CR=1 FL=1